MMAEGILLRWCDREKSWCNGDHAYLLFSKTVEVQLNQTYSLGSELSDIVFLFVF